MLRERAEFIESLERDLRMEEGKILAIRHDFLALPKESYPSRCVAIRRTRAMVEEIQGNIFMLRDRIEANWNGAMEESPFQEDALDRIEVCRADLRIIDGTVEVLTVLGKALAEGWDIIW